MDTLTLKDNRELVESAWSEFDKVFGKNRKAPQRGVIPTNLGLFVFWTTFEQYPNRTAQQVADWLGGLLGEDPIDVCTPVVEHAGRSICGCIVDENKFSDLTTLAVWLAQCPATFDGYDESEGNKYRQTREQLLGVKFSL